MARKPIDSTKREKIIKALNKGKKPVDIARTQKVSAGFIYSLRSKLKEDAKKVDDSLTAGQKAAATRAANKSSIKETIVAPVIQENSAVKEITEQITRRESEIATLKDTLSLLAK